MSVNPPPTQALFTLKDGVVESAADQSMVDAFAADFQGLRHFGNKMGEALDMGEPWTGTLQESDMTVIFLYEGEGTGPKDAGTGVLLGRQSLLLEALTLASEHQQPEA